MTIMLSMTTSIHLPPALLRRLDARAADEGMSRSAYLRRLVEQDVGEAWSAEFTAFLHQAPIDDASAKAWDGAMERVAADRTTSPAPDFARKSASKSRR